LSSTSSNTFPKPGRTRHRRLACRWLILFCLGTAHQARALGPNKDISQYIRTEWTSDQGFPGGPVYAFAQTPDGYLWIGTERGLVRFDGLSFYLFRYAGTANVPLGPVMGLAVDTEGSLWIRTQGPKFLKFYHGEFEDVLPHLQRPERDVTAMCQGTNGEIFFYGLENGLVRYSHETFVVLATPVQVQEKLIISLAETPDGTVWAGTRDAGLLQVQGEKVAFFARGLPNKKINSVLPINARELWVSMDDGIAQWDGAKFSRPRASPLLDQVRASVILKDHDSNLWIGTANALVRLNPNGTVQVDRRATPPASGVRALFEDREGNLWLGTGQGIARLRDSVFTTYTVPAAQGLNSAATGPVFADSRGRIWFAPENGGLYWLENGRITRVTDPQLDDEVIYSITGNEGELWLGRQRRGLAQLRFHGPTFTTQTYTQSQGLAQNNVYAVYRARDGSLWAGTLSGGVSRFSSAAFQNYSMADGLASNSVTSILVTSDGAIWFGTPNGLSAFTRGKWRTFNSCDGLPPGTIDSLLQDVAGVLWIGTANGLAFLNGGSIHLAQGPEPLHEAILGLAEDKVGSLWIATPNHILQVSRDKLLRGELRDLDMRDYGTADGLRSAQGVKRQLSVLADSSGRIWISTVNGLSFVDPRPVTLASSMALVHLESVAADGRPYSLQGRLRISAPHQRVTFSYTALSLAVPERIRFRYKLDSFDHDWSEPTANREAVYTNLDTGAYVFRVISSNSEGLWNSSEATLQFLIEPAFWQTWWFRLLSLLAIVALTLALIRLRLLQLAKHLNLRFEERLAERTRIAQELHDTLLQGFVSASMQLHVANEQVAADSPAKPVLARVLQLMNQVVQEARNALQGLRSAKGNSVVLEQALLKIREEFPALPHTEFRVIVDGEPRPLHAAIRDEIYLIGREALSNAFRHSQASAVEVELEYAAAFMRLLIRDNGHGIDSQILQSGRAGHWGLSVMKERTARIGGTLRVLSRPSAGTELELNVPGRIAFETDSARRGGWWSRSYRKLRREREQSRDKDTR
jgi:ligand-binding sensor domain-containing protein/signal transduction histidine kinase